MDEEIVINEENEIVEEQPIDPQQVMIDQLKQSLYMDNVIATVKTLTLAFGEVSGLIDKTDLQTMVTRSKSTGKYYIHLSDMIFPVEEARLILTIPEEGRQRINPLEKNKGVVEVSKFALENFTRIDGKAMPNEKVVL
jgi:hypothetical protein